MIHHQPIRWKWAMIDDISMKGKRKTIHFLLQKQILQQLFSNHIGREKMRHLACESVCWINMKTDIRNTMIQCAACMEYQHIQICEKIMPCRMPHRPWEVVGANILPLKIIIVYYYRKFPVLKETHDLVADNLIRMVKILFAKF